MNTSIRGVEYIMERSVEDVQEFIINRMDVWFEDMDEDSKEYDILSKAYDNIQTDCMLSKEQAKLLESCIHNELDSRIGDEYMHQHNLALFIDELSIYTDAWAQYCRPGTYRI